MNNVFGALALLCMGWGVVSMVGIVRRRPHARRNLVLGLAAAFVFAGLLRDEPPAPAQATQAPQPTPATADVQARLVRMLDDPEGTGGTCLSASQGRSCVWEAGEDFASAEAALRPGGAYTLILSDPAFTLRDLGVEADPGPGQWSVPSGPLAGVTVQAPALNSGTQITLSSP